jgi:predicted DNA-binding transcriptional regulator AlpA
MIRLLRFRDLQERGIVKSWPQLKRLTEKYGFPKGRMISPNIRTWTEAEVDAWFESRPTTGPAPRGAAKTRRGRPRKAAANTDAAATA